MSHKVWSWKTAAGVLDTANFWQWKYFFFKNMPLHTLLSCSVWEKKKLCNTQALFFVSSVVILMVWWFTFPFLCISMFVRESFVQPYTYKGNPQTNWRKTHRNTEILAQIALKRRKKNSYRTTRFVNCITASVKIVIHAGWTGRAIDIKVLSMMSQTF